MKKLHTIIVLLLVFLFANAQNPGFEWAKGLISDGGVTPWAIAVDHEGNIISTGYFSGTCDFNPGNEIYNLESKGHDDIFIQKLNPSGEFIWAKRIGNEYTDRCNDVAVDADGNIFITGTFALLSDFDTGSSANNPDGKYDVYIAKYSPDGDFMWVAATEQLNQEYLWASNDGLSIDIDTNGDVVATGSFQGLVDFNPGNAIFTMESWGVDCFVLKLSNSGEFIWSKMIGSYGEVEGQTIKTDAANNIYISGGFDEYATDFDPGSGETILEPEEDYFFTGFLLKLNSNGDFKWAVKPGGGADNQNYELKRPIAIDNDGNVLLSYMISQFAPADLDPSTVENIFNATGGDDIFIQKLDSLGNLIWAKQLGGEDNDLIRDVLVDKKNSIYLTGKFYNEMDFDPDEETHIVSRGWSIGDIPFILKLNKEGQFQWVYTIGNPNEEWSTGTNLDLALDANNNVICSGYMYESSFDFNENGESSVIQGNNDFSGFIYKLNQSGGTGNKSIRQILSNVYPSPVENELYINLGDEFEKASISIYSATGILRLKKSSCTYTNQIIDVSYLEKGIYFIEISSDHMHETQKIIKR